MLEDALSDRQMQLVKLSADGLTDKEIAIRLGVSGGTVRTYWDRLRIRLDASSRTEIVAAVLKRRHAEVKAERDNLLRVLNLLPQFVWTARPDGFVDYCNEWFQKAGIGPETSHGRGCRALMLPDELPEGSARWQRAQVTGEAYEADVRFRIADTGVVVPHRVRLTPMRYATGEIYRWVGIAHER